MSCVKRATRGFPVILFFIFCCFFVIPALAVERVDSDFGDNGFAVKDFGIGDDEALALAVQPDGRYLVAGYSSNGAVNTVALARYLPDGTLDLDFNYTGVVTLNLGAGDSVASSVTVQKDGRILLAGSSFDLEPRLVVVALMPDGRLDSGFADDGQFVMTTRDEEVVSADLDISADGSIIVAATMQKSDSSRYPLFVKLTSTGEFADGFGEDGIVRYEQDYDIEIHSFTLLKEGKLLAAGAIEQDGLMQAGLLLRNADGTLAASFGTNGEYLLDIEGDGSSVVNDLWLEPGGDVLLAGSTENTELRQAFGARLLATGGLDPDFAGNGLFRSTLSYANEAYAVTKQQDGTIVLAGFGSSATGKDAIIWNIAENVIPAGADKDEVILDAEQQIVLRALAFPDDAIEDAKAEFDPHSGQEQVQVTTHIITDVANGDDVGYAIVPLASGEILMAGSAGNGVDKDFVLARYTAKDIDNTLIAVDSKNGVVTADYSLTTIPVEGITRVGGVTGGYLFDTQTLSCETFCTIECEEDADPTTCYDSCLTTCEERPTVKLRGVVYGVSVGPSYDDGSGAATPASSTSTTSTSTPATTTATSTTASTDSNSILPSSDKSFDYVVRSGQTEDGSGLGVYGSEIMDVTPNITYYVRAYAVLSDDTVIYGNEISFKTDDACFIATATYGSILDRRVVLLRQFRDVYLMPSSLGRGIVALYYQYSPPAAAVIRKDELLRSVVQISLWPVVAFALFMLKTSLLMKIIVILMTLLGTSWLVRLKRNLRAR